MLHLDCNDNCVINMNGPETIAPITNLGLFDQSQLILVYDSLLFDRSNGEVESCSFVLDDYREQHNGVDINSHNVCCRGAEACYGIATIESTAAVVCSGTDGCNSVGNIIANSAVFCSGQESCRYSNITATDVYCVGSLSCSQTQITAQNVYCSGLDSCKESSISTSGSIYFTGASWNQPSINITCQDGHICDIICTGYFTCTSVQCHGQCNVQCDTENGCPLGYGGASGVNSGCINGNICIKVKEFASETPTPLAKVWWWSVYGNIINSSLTSGCTITDCTGIEVRKHSRIEHNWTA
eukprot:254103_1